MENLPSNLFVFNSPSSLCNIKENRIILFETHFTLTKWFTHLPSSEECLRKTLFVHFQDITKSLYLECLRRYNQILKYKGKENNLLNIDNIVLKFMGKEDYLIDMNAPLFSYAHVQKCISKNVRIKIEFLQIDKIESILQYYSPPPSPLIPSLPPVLTSILQYSQITQENNINDNKIE